MNATETIITLRRAIGEGQVKTAQELVSGAVSFLDHAAELITLQGLVCRLSGDTARAEAAFKRALILDPANPEALLNLGQMLRKQERNSEALEHLLVLQSKFPSVKETYLPLAEILSQLKDLTLLPKVLKTAGQAGALTSELLLTAGNAWHMAGDHIQAADCYRQLLSMKPDDASAWFNLSVAQAAYGRLADAIASIERLVEINPGHLMAWSRLAELYRQAGRWPDAVGAYQRALVIDPKHRELRVNLGYAYSRLGKWTECFEESYKAWEQGCLDPVAFMNMGNACHALRQHGPALDWYRKGLATTPGHLPLRTEAIHVQQKVCDWTGFDRLREEFLVPALVETNTELAPSPFACVALPIAVSPIELRGLADRYAARLVQGITPLPKRLPQAGGGRIRIGYLSADYHNHATAHLMLSMFGRHDRKRFEIHAYSLGADDGSHYRKRIVADCDSFSDLMGLTDEEAAQRIRFDAIDILVDLKGYTGGARPWILAYRPAPIQVNYLGYPGTMGAGFINYIVADPVVLPPAEFSAYAEAPVLMPHTYQVNDREQPISPKTGDRAAHGLPAQGFVFCCFNSPYKIEPTVFAVWMRLLRALPGSVLWLFAGDPLATKNLRQAATAAGVDPARLVFAPKMNKADHLARHLHADLFLDTLFYNAHTTASDALWAGVPVLTRMGTSFAGRVAASLLRAAGMTELIAASLPAYEALALELAKNPARLAALKQRLMETRLKVPLFDTGLFVRHLETAYDTMVATARRGDPPAPIMLKP